VHFTLCNQLFVPINVRTAADVLDPIAVTVVMVLLDAGAKSVSNSMLVYVRRVRFMNTITGDPLQHQELEFYSVMYLLYLVAFISFR
jgi:hypothetical protein